MQRLFRGFADISFLHRDACRTFGAPDVLGASGGRLQADALYGAGAAEAPPLSSDRTTALVSPFA